MAFKTMQALITDVERALYQSAGAQVQIYSQDIIQQQLQHAFNHLFDLHWWPRFITRLVLTLDGTTGQTTTLPTGITDYRDIRYVFAGNYTRPLAKLSLDANPASVNLGSGGFPRFIEGTNDTKLFRVYPITATGTVTVVGRARPADYDIDQLVTMDPTLLVHFAAWSYFTDDASNPAAAERHQGLFENRLKHVEDTEFNEPIQLNTRDRDIPSRWTETW
jgi:hypothetical protein